jgi:polyhydroxyalkanoate synthesis regulator phasin
MMYAKIENDIITGIYCGNKPKGTVEIPDSFIGIVGQNIKEFDENYNLRPLSVRVVEQLVSIPAMHKLDGEMFVPMTDIELYKSGDKQVPLGMILDGDELRSATIEEQVIKGELTQEEANKLIIDKMKASILARLSEIDTLSARPLRAILTDTATEYDRQKLLELETEAESLRTQLAGLE